MSVDFSVTRSLAVAAIWAAATTGLCADPPANTSADVERLIVRLDDDNFETRHDALEKLRRLAADPATHAAVRKQAEARLANRQTTLDVREALRVVLAVEPPGATPKPAPPPAKDSTSTDGTEPKRIIRPVLPKPATTEPAPPIKIPAVAELDGLLKSVESPTFEIRDQAERQLLAAAESPALCGPVMERLLAVAESPDVSIDAARRWGEIWQTAWGTWLADQANAWRPKLPDDQQLTAVVARLEAAESAGNRPAWVRDHAVAARLLLLWIADEGPGGRTAEALRRRVDSSDITIDAVGRLGVIHAWSHPAMAAEFWVDGMHQAVQHLLLGVPNQPPGAPRPSLFDRCDDKVAHCVSGNSLAPGDHPVGVFFPHPSELQQNAMFHLVNLPTPRRRLAYEFTFPIAKKSDVALDAISDQRRGPITRRTTAYLLEQKRILTPREIDMFQFLEPADAAKFAEPYLLNVDDERYDSGSPTPFGNGSLHGWFCYLMTIVGTPESGRAVAAAIDKGRILPPTASKPYRVEWAAVLDLAHREPWPDVDRWLADHVDRTEPLNINEADAADVGASCAALLLERNGGDPSAFGLEHAEFDELIDLGQPGYRFADPESRAAVKRWWAERKKSS